MDQESETEIDEHGYYQDKKRLGKLKVGYDGTRPVGGILSIGLGLLLAFYFAQRIYTVTSTREHIYNSKHLF